MNKIPRLIDIAKLANVSVGTVDRVLHNRGTVAKETRAVVLKIAKELGYQPNLFATALATTNRAQRVCCLVPQQGVDPFWDEVHVGINEAISQIGPGGMKFVIEEFDLFDPTSFEASIDALKMDEYDGIMVAPIFLRESQELVRILEEHGKPYVMINTMAEQTSDLLVCYVGPDAYQSGRLAARLLSLHCNPGDEVMMIPLEKNFLNAFHMVEKERGFRDRFDEIAPGVEVLTCEFELYDDPKELAIFLSSHLKAHTNLKGIYTSASRINRIASYFDLVDINHIKLVGYDSLADNVKYLEMGRIHYLINQNPALMGYMGLINLRKFLMFKSRPEKMQYMPLDVLLPENVSFFSRHFLLKDQRFANTL